MSILINISISIFDKHIRTGLYKTCNININAGISLRIQTNDQCQY